ncbi:MAG: phytochrome sensor protein, partial [Pedosphaera sp.]|nr:phytochrome sensor protein [Pedosphaera sp.]
MALRTRRSSSSGTTILLAVVIVVAVLHFAREIFIPFALAVLFSFLLAPLVNRLRHWRLPRVPAVLIVVLLAFAVVGSIGGFMVSQMADLARKLPQYEQNVRHKVESLTAGDGGILGRVERTLQSLHRDLTSSASSPTQTQPARTEGASPPVPVEMQASAFSPMHVVRTVLGSILGILVTGFVVVVFVIFMLVEREDLRDRIIRLAGTGKLNVTTQLLDDASQRVSRYLLMQLIVNISYGIPIGLGLFFIGVPNPLLWGLLAALLRYIPYAGTWIAASMPFALAMAVDPGWTKPLMVAGLWTVVEMIVANVVEPWVYGASAGITPLSVLVAAVFWTW